MEIKQLTSIVIVEW